MWAVALVLFVALIVGPTPAERPTETYERPRVGLAVEIPDGWRIVRRQLTACTDPVQRIAVRRGPALVQIVERLSSDVSGFPDRPRRFALQGPPQWLECCPPADAKGWFIAFRDGGRGFYAYAYVSGPATRDEALGILDSFRVRPRAEPAAAAA